ncbi:WhiB family transcriptional regulator [Rhodococcus opacus]|uniref:WhiB family transcriptional regulator n=1 Tax=Rhodococcus opacus TaxID=37919 RepID=UPI000EA9BE5B|nr:WhiB family transcriptional regulator [Rhodococcus opacus]QZS59294.1 WhiB family transcriptional regulator [Rhodococcus opacus]RKM74125.1 transcriptional regulator [Rhodococcus opacus]UZG55392.1 WhiB family transcriptional regulator [Rhodococcus opacus]WKN55197.1 WhiB family transcriptional regulator [Rhodococcus opacus]
MCTPNRHHDLAHPAPGLDWITRARCREGDPDRLFVTGAAQRKAAALCRHCPVLMECGAYALDNRIEFGVWGGMTERQRRALLAAHPGVRWSERFTNPPPVG